MIKPLHINGRFGSTRIQNSAGPLELIISGLWLKCCRTTNIPMNFVGIQRDLNHLKDVQYEHLK